MRYSAVDYILQLASDYGRDPDMLRWGLTASVSIAVLLLVLGLAYYLASVFGPGRARLRRVVGESASYDNAASKIATKLQPLAPYILPKKDWERNRIKAQLVHAGYRSSYALTVFYGAKTALGVVLALVVLILIPILEPLLERQLSALEIVTSVLVASVVGMVFPNFVLNRLVERRQRIIQKGFPDALDMIVVCVEAGIGLTAALQRVARELQSGYPQLAEEFELVNAEIRAGADRNQALKNLGSRTGVQEVQIFAGLIGQTLRFGTSIADTLRVYAEDFRDKRMQRAEEQAAKIGTKMIFPLVLCLFPSFFVVAVGPAIIKVLKAFG